MDEKIFEDIMSDIIVVSAEGSEVNICVIAKQSINRVMLSLNLRVTIV